MSAALKAARMGPRGYRPSSRIVQGDPGLFGWLGKAAGTIIRTAGTVTGILPAPTRAGAIPAPMPVPVTTAMTGGARGMPRPQVVPRPGPGGFIERLVPGGKTGYEVDVPMNGKGAPKGYHLNKSDYWLKDGTFVPKGSRYVKNRRRNPLNPTALRRAVGRVDAGKIWQAKLHEIETAKFTKAGNRKAC